MKIVRFKGDFESWRNEARSLLSDKVHFEKVLWQASDDHVSSLFDQLPETATLKKTNFTIPREFMEEAEWVAAFRDDSTWSLLYKLAYRLVYEDRHLLQIKLDQDVLDFERRKKLVTRDLHKMKAFVRFREIQKNDQTIYVAWHRPDHHVLKFSAPFFTDRFNGMNWIIFTEELSMSWMDNQLTYGAGLSQKEAESFDATEELWKTYYGSIFNPARIKIQAMKNELPVRHWKTLPEATLIDQLIAEAPARLDEFYQAQRPSAVQLIPQQPKTLLEIKEHLNKCEACAICEMATGPVFGSGNPFADIVFVGEQPGEEEDRAGIPFIGAAGDIFNRTLAKAGILRNDVYVTNAVKAFKWKKVNGQRQHRSPMPDEIGACRPWVKAELDFIKPKVLVCMGGSAAQSVFGKLMQVSESRGKIFKTAFSDQTIIVNHPAAILRTKDMVIQARMLLDFEKEIEFALKLADSYNESSKAPLFR